MAKAKVSTASAGQEVTKETSPVDRSPANPLVYEPAPQPVREDWSGVPRRPQGEYPGGQTRDEYLNELAAIAAAAC